MLLQIIARAAWEYEQRIVLSTWEFVAVPILLILFILIGFNYTLRNKKNKLIQKYFFKGLLFKLFGVVFFCLIYLYYYGGGDTINYFESSMAFAKLFYKNPQRYFEVLFSKPSIESFFLFDDSTGFPWSYMYFESTTCMVVKITSFFTIITARSYLLTSLLIAFITYFGVWKLFQLFCQYSPRIENRLAWAILYFPSPLFWGSGVSKDTFTYFATVLFVYSAHEFFIKKKRSIAYFSLLIFGVWLILNIKPYILLVLLPGGLLWLFYNKLVLVKNRLLLLILFPIILVAVVGISFFILGQLGDNMSKFSLDNALNTASTTNYDLKQSYYKGSSFNIGDFDGTIMGMFKLCFPAINAGLFRPYVWESSSAVLLLAGIENFLLLIFTVYILFKTRVIGTFRIIFKDPILLFCVMFSVLFAFMIGLTTSNFGALVRFKIPLIPFFVSALFIIYDRYKFGEKK